MIPAEFQSFFAASSSAGAALVGLLFVAVSLRPEETLGREAPAERRVVAYSAFSALTDAFFMSLGGLLPLVNVGALAVAAGVLSVVGTVRLALQLMRVREGRYHLTLVLGSMVVYGVQVAVGVELLQSPGSPEAVGQLAGLMLMVYAIGLGRAWELLGAERAGLRRLMRSRKRD